MKKVGSVISLSFLVLFLLVGCKKSSSDWVKLKEYKDGNVYSYKIENVDKKGSNEKVKLWLEQVISDKNRQKKLQERKENGLSTKGYEKLSTILWLYELDCNQKKERILSINDYDTDGMVLYSGDTEEKEWKYIVPGSMGDTITKEVCK
jgi:hypothetical protein